MAVAIGAIGGSAGYISFLLITEQENVIGFEHLKLNIPLYINPRLKNIC